MPPSPLKWGLGAMIVFDAQDRVITYSGMTLA